jgi:tripartite-type tricarboxylate transporter receptor subunit TctC
MKMRTWHMLVIGAAIAMLEIGTAAAQSYPTKPVRMIVPFAPGGRVEVVARILADALSKDLGQPFLVESRAGAGGSIGADFVAKSAPDGYTLLLSSAGVLSILPNVDKKLPYDSVKNFTPIAKVMDGFTYIGAYPGLGLKTIADLVAAAKAKPDTLGYASSGVGTYSHLAGELVKIAAGAPIKHIPYKGSGPALNDIVAGHVALMIGGEIGELTQAGKITMLATTNEQRSPDFPNVPTMKESGFPQFVAHSWIGIVGPAGMDKAIVDRLSATISKVLADPAAQKKLIEQGGQPNFQSADVFAKQISGDIKIYADIISKAGLKFD